MQPDGSDKTHSTLLPCPFCGSEAERREEDGEGLAVACSNRKCDPEPSTWFYENPDDAIQAWNGRVPELAEKVAPQPGSVRVAGRFIQDVLVLCDVVLGKRLDRGAKPVAEFVRYMAEPYRQKIDGVAPKKGDASNAT